MVFDDQRIFVKEKDFSKNDCYEKDYGKYDVRMIVVIEDNLGLCVCSHLSAKFLCGNGIIP